MAPKAVTAPKAKPTIAPKAKAVAKAKPVAKARAGRRTMRNPNPVPFVLHEAANRTVTFYVIYTPMTVDLVVNFLIGCTTTELQHWLQIMLQRLPCLLGQVAPLYCRRARSEALMVGYRARLSLPLVVMPNGIVRHQAAV